MILKKLFRIALVFQLVCILIQLFLFHLQYETFIDVDSLIADRFSIVILHGHEERNVNKLRHFLPESDVDDSELDHHCISKEMTCIEESYKKKYIQALEERVARKMFVMILEDDVTPVYVRTAFRYHLVINTLSLFANSIENYDCSSRGFYLKTGSTDNKTLCRIFSKEVITKEFLACLKQTDGPIDISIGKCQNDLDIVQKRFLLVNHSGISSTLQHI